jgi:hypothetical protein
MAEGDEEGGSKVKRAYSKPDIIFEDFSLSAGIAAGCEKKIDTKYSGQCGLIFGDLMMFVDSVAACADPVVDGAPKYNGLCYHIPSDSKNLFNS